MRFLSVACSAFCLFSGTAQAAELSAVEARHRENRLEIRLQYAEADNGLIDKARAFALPNPHRLVLDLPGIGRRKKWDIPLPDTVMPHVSDIRIGRHRSFLRLVLDMKQAPVYRLVQETAEGGRKQLLLIVELPVRAKEEKLRPLVVVIDPGHGGRDPGAINASGLQEKHVALQISMKLHQLLSGLLEFEVHLTRSDDTYLTLAERREKAQQLKADLFLSIHADAARKSRVRGASVYVLSLRGASSEAARRLAKRENAPPKEVLRVGGIPLEQDQDFNYGVVDLAQTPTIERSLNIAQSVLGQLSEVSHIHSEDAGRANFAVLRSPYIPSILLETGFLTNNKDAAALVNQRFQRRLIRAVLAGIYLYLKENPHPGIAVHGGMSFFHYRVQKNDNLSRIAEAFGMLTADLKKHNALKSNIIHPDQILKIPVPKGFRSER